MGMFRMGGMGFIALLYVVLQYALMILGIIALVLLIRYLLKKTREDS